MSGLTPSPPPDASGTVRGLVGLVAQTFAGIKTFTSAIVASAGVRVASIFNNNGTGASDVGVKVGVSTADGSVNAAAKPFSVRTGIGGTEVEKFWVDKGGDFRTGGTVGSTGWFRGQSATLGYLSIDDSNGSRIVWGGQTITLGTGITLNSTGAYLNVYTTTGITRSFAADGAAAVAHDIDTNSAWSNVTAKIMRWLTAGAERAAVTALGRFDQFGTDSTGTPGAATINKPTGKSSIAIGAASVVITNSLVSTASRVIITPHARDTTCKELIAVPAAGSFTVSGTANATAALPFSWQVSNII